MNNANYVFNVIVKENGKEEQMKAQKIVMHALKQCVIKEGKKVQQRVRRNVKLILDMIMIVEAMQRSRSTKLQRNSTTESRSTAESRNCSKSPRRNTYY